MDSNTAPDLAPRLRDLVALMLLTLIFRLAWFVFGAWEANDSSWYLTTARNLAFHHVFSAGITDLQPTAYRPPLYSVFVSLVWLGEGVPTRAVMLTQVILGVATVALVYLTAIRQFNRTVAIIASAGLVVAPLTNHFTVVILSETLFTFLLTLGVFLWGNRLYALTGVAFGLATLTRTTLLPFVIVLPLLTLIPHWRPQRRGYLIIMLVALGIAGVWVLRNAVVFKQFIPVAGAGSGTNLLLGSLETKDADDVTKRKAFLAGIDQRTDQTATNEVEFDRNRLRAAVERIKSDPGPWLIARAEQYPRLFIDSGSYLIGNSALSLRATLQAGQLPQALVRMSFIAGNLAVFLCALLSIIGYRASLVSLSHIILFPIFLCVVHLPLWVEPRYGLPMMPMVAILAAAGLLRLSSLLRRRSATAPVSLATSGDRG